MFGDLSTKYAYFINLIIFLYNLCAIVAAFIAVASVVVVVIVVVAVVETTFSAIIMLGSF